MMHLVNKNLIVDVVFAAHSLCIVIRCKFGNLFQVVFCEWLYFGVPFIKFFQLSVIKCFVVNLETESSFLLIVCFCVNLETESRLRDLTFRSSDRRSLRGSATSLRLKSRIRSNSALRDLQEINLNENYLQLYGIVLQIYLTNYI